MEILLPYIYAAIAFSTVTIFLLRRAKDSTEPAGLSFRWIVTGLSLALWVYLGYLARSGAWYVPLIIVLNAIYLSVLWTPSLAEGMLSPLTRWYDGGDEEPELRPLYSIAEACRKRGQYDRAIQEVRRQLERFPEDYEGWMKIAEIQAVDLKNHDEALATVERVLSIPELAPKNVSFALGRVADWEVERSNRDGAQAAFQRIINRLPGTVEAQLAEQRIAHLASAEHIADMHEPRVIALKHFPVKIGLSGERVAAPEPENPAVVAQNCLNHLRDYPFDNEVRENLAMVYANDFKRLDLAAAELEQLIATPNQLPKNIVHWLNHLADFQIRLEAGADAARTTLERIIELFPNSAAANAAAVRISQLKLELNRHSQQRTVQLGKYEQNIGLRKMNSSGSLQQ